MADTTMVSVSAAYMDEDGINRAGMSAAGATATVATPGEVSGRMTVGTGEVAIPVGSLTPRLLVCVNRSASQTVTIKKAAAGETLCTMRAGEPCVIPLPSGVTAPVAAASAADATLDFLVCNT